MRRGPGALLAGLAVAGLVAAPGVAGDRSITGTISEQVIADSNVQLESGGDPSIGSITTLSLAYVDRMPSSTLSLGTGFNFAVFSEEQNDNISGLFPRLNGAYSVRRPTQSLSINFNGSVTPVDFLQNTGIILPGAPDAPEAPTVDDDDPDAPDDAPDVDPVETVNDRIAERDALRVSLGAGASWSQTINSAESVNLGANFGLTEFIDGGPSLVPNTRFGVDAGWSRRVAADATAGVSTGASLFLSGGDENRRTFTVRLGPTASWDRTARERLSISIGPSFNHSTFDRQLAGGGTISETETDVSLSGNAAFSFAGDVDSLNVNLSQSVLPDDDGAIVNTTSLTVGWGRRLSQAARLNWTGGAVFRTDAFGGGGGGGFEDRLDYRTRLGWSYRVNPRHSGNLSLLASRDDDGAGAEEIVVGAGAGWSYALAPRTNANLGYDVRYETEDELVSHRVGLTLSHGFTLLP
ncbi:MAG: hypothetical protein R6V44_14925 [Paracoccaceae bacterium]